jgi:hypothetical protein
MPWEPRSGITSTAISVSPSAQLAVLHQGRRAVDSVLGSRVERGEPAAPGHGWPVAFGSGPRSEGVIHEHS